MRVRLFSATLLLGCVLAATLVHADEPLPAPAAHEIKSPNGLFSAKTDPITKTTSIFKKGALVPWWTVPGWYRSLWVADDGRAIIACYDGLNLLARDDKKADTVMATFFAMDGKKRTVTLGQLLMTLVSLRPTVSHYQWGSCNGFDEKGRFIIETVEKRKFSFDQFGVRIP